MSEHPTTAELAEALLTSPDTPRDVATEMVVRMIEELEAKPLHCPPCCTRPCCNHQTCRFLVAFQAARKEADHE